MNDPLHNELMALNKQLLDSIASGDWDTYAALCDPSLSAFEPEARGHLIEGMDFHRFYFQPGGMQQPHNTSISSPHVRILGDVAVVSYIRLIQHTGDAGGHVTTWFEETRVWHKQPDGWRNVHFHRSANR